MKCLVTITMAMPFLATAGCQVAPVPQPHHATTETVSYMTVSEFTKSLAAEEGVLLVEFCVPSGCFRCDQMRGPIERLASDRRDDLTVRRVNVKQQPELAWEFGVTVCPSYVAFRNGEEVFRAAFPTSADLIASGIKESLLGPSADQLTLAVQ